MRDPPAQPPAPTRHQTKRDPMRDPPPPLIPLPGARRTGRLLADGNADTCSRRPLTLPIPQHPGDPCERSIRQPATNSQGHAVPSYRPTNRPIDLRKAEDYPTHRAKRRYRQLNRKRIARTAQAERDKNTNRTT